MQVVSYTEARNSLKAVLDSVVDNADCTIITRRDAANAAHLQASIEQYQLGKTLEKGLVNED